MWNDHQNLIRPAVYRVFMRSTRRAFLGTLPATVGLSGCLGGGESTPTPTETPDPREEGITLEIQQHNIIGTYLVGPDGMTVYLFEEDTQGGESSACTGECAEQWPPVTGVSPNRETGGITAEFSTFERADGSRQVTANGWPLYYYTGDEESFDVNGQGVNDVWWAVDQDGNPIKREV